MIHVTCRLTAKNRDQLWNPTLGNRVRATFLCACAVVVNCTWLSCWSWLSLVCCRLKWFHVYRIRLILNHDEYVGRHLHVPNTSGKYNTVSCRQAMDLVFSLLYRQASFVLIDKHTYVTLLYRLDVLLAHFKRFFCAHRLPVVVKMVWQMTSDLTDQCFHYVSLLASFE